MLIKSGFLHRTDEFGTETLICTMKLHEILRAMGLCGYRSWAGVSRISFKETVPSGYKSKDWNDWGCTEIEASMVEVEEEGYRRVAHSGLWEPGRRFMRSEEHTSELQSLMRNSYAVFCLKKK